VKRSTVSLIAVAVFLRIASPEFARAWSGSGHQAVCQIAFLELQPATRARLNTIMAREKDDNFKPFATACTWPDSQKHTNGTIQSKRKDEHFVNVDRGLTSISTDSCGVASTCLFTAIPADEAALKNSTGQDQLVALKFLGHWVGDLHQPLHVSYADDLGGNDIPVSAAAGCKELHAVWDECIVQDLRQQMGAKPGPTDLGSKLDAEITDAERAAWRQGSLVDWAEESYQVTRAAGTKYCIEEGQSCCYDATHCEYKSAAAKTKRLSHLSHKYDDGEVATARERLKKAGVRLASILDAQLQ
jgi:nuclease S1